MSDLKMGFGSHPGNRVLASSTAMDPVITW